MDIAIVANFCSALDSPTNSRFTYLAEMLRKDHSVELVGSDFCHDSKAARICDYSRFDYKVNLIHEPGYKRNISIKRFLSHRIWGKNVIKYFRERKKPDVVYCAVPSLSVASLLGKYCNTNGIRFIIDIQDLWPEAFRMVFNIPVISDVLFLPFRNTADKAYRRADVICAVSDTYAERALQVNNKVDSACVVYLGTDLSCFDTYAEKKNCLPEKKRLRLCYCGSLSDSYDICCVIDALVIMGKKAPEFIVVGDGHLKKDFEIYAKEKSVDALFLGYRDYSEMCSILCSCDIAINPIRGKSAASIINKHADYAAAGIPVVNTQESAEYRSLVENYSMGFNCSNGDAKDIASRLGQLMHDSSLRTAMGINARRCAEERFDRKETYKNLVNCIVGLKEMI